MEHNKATIIALLETNNKAVERAILAIYENQTTSEKRAEKTIESNCIGFNGVDARLGTYYAKYLLSGKHLSGEHIDKARKIIRKYTRQLLDIAKGKAASKMLRSF
jgi:hypothetical protein